MSFSLGVISDTHGLLRPEAVQVIESCDAIIHAGDVGSKEVLSSLEAMTPVHAVRGNVDWEPWTLKMPVNDVVEIAGRFFYVIHILDNIDIDPAAAGIDAVIYGHSHQPDLFEKNGVIYMNPGSAGPRRFTKPVSMGKIKIDENGFYPEIINLL